MDGDVCPFIDLVKLAEKHNATVILDEAHSTGIIGKNGSGLAISLGLDANIPIRVYTFGKAMGVHGACVVGSKTLINYLINFARPFIFTTAMAPHSVASIDCAFEYIIKHNELQPRLQEKINLFKSEFDKLKIARLPSDTQIQGVVIPGNEQIKTIADSLIKNGFDVRPILSPTVAKGLERLRICLHTFNSKEEIAQLALQLSKV
jgi:8-amino-7-oxononanoate synthase